MGLREHLNASPVQQKKVDKSVNKNLNGFFVHKTIRDLAVKAEPAPPTPLLEAASQHEAEESKDPAGTVHSRRKVPVKKDSKVANLSPVLKNRGQSRTSQR